MKILQLFSLKKPLAKHTRREQIIMELSRGNGTARQIADRTGLSLNMIRVVLTGLRKNGKIVSVGKAGKENVWTVTQ